MKYYKLLQELPIWEKGAIVHQKDINSSYSLTDEIYFKGPKGTEDYMEGKELVENCPEWFQRVYKIDMLTKVLYETKEKALDLINKNFK